MKHATAAILSIGDELTLGQALDTNSQWVSSRLLEAGVVTVEHATVRDDRGRIAGAIPRLTAAADLVIVTGGLGPTEDDLTRQALADALGEDLVSDEEAAAAIRTWFEGRGRAMPERNLVQALRPRSAVCLANANGTAPGLHAMVDGVDVFCLPGPPVEMRPMFEALVRPRLRSARVVVTRAVHSFGLGESEVAERLGDLMRRDRGVLVGTTARYGMVTCRVRWEAAPGAQGTDFPAEPVKSVAREIHERLGEYVFGEDDRTLAGAVLELLRARGETLATVESCTGGMLGGAVTDVPGSSAAYVGGWVTYTDGMKAREVGVAADLLGARGPGAVSREVAEAMARGGMERSGAAHCVSVTGIAGPGGGTPVKPVGTVWIAVASRGEGGARVASRRFIFAGGREGVRAWATGMALAMVRLRLIGREGLALLREVAAGRGGS